MKSYKSGRYKFYLVNDKSGRVMFWRELNGVVDIARTFDTLEAGQAVYAYATNQTISQLRAA